MRKQTPLAIIGIFALLVLTLNVVSAAPNGGDLKMEVISVPSSVDSDATSFEVVFNITNTGNNHTIDGFENSSSVGSWSINQSVPFNLSTDETITLKATLTFPKQTAGTDIVGQINATSGSLVPGQVNINVSVTQAPITGCMDVNATNYNANATVAGTCNYPEPELSFACPASADDNDIEFDKLRDESDVEDDWEWRPLEEVSILVKDVFHEIGSDDDDDADLVIELYFVDPANNTEVSSDIVDDTDDLEDDMNLDYDEEEDFTFEFEIEGDVEEGTYDLYVKIYEEDNEAGECIVVLEEDVKIEKKTRDVIVNDVDGPETVKAGDSVTFEVEAANLGSKDEDKVKIIAYNSELGILNSKEINDLDEGDKDTITLIVQIPEDALEGDYEITFSTEYDYDEDDEIYDEESDSDDDIDFTVTVLEGKSSAPLIGARLISDAELGEVLEVEIAIQNPGRDAKFYLAVEGADEWAEEIELDNSYLNVDKGDTESTIVSFVPTETGKQKFTVIVEYDGKTSEQDVSVNIGEKSGLLTGAFAGLGFGLGPMGAALVWAIIILVVIILIVLIIKLATPRRRVETHNY